MDRPAQSGRAPGPGDVVGRWRLHSALGSGGMATVWRAAPVEGGEDIALKILHQTRLAGDEIRRMQREYLTLIRLDHPNIVKVIESGQHAGFPWLALHYVRGEDLGQLLARWAQAEPQDRFVRAERIIRELCAALSYVHARRIIHRDMKPGNVLIGEDGRAFLTDFGVVKDVESFSTNLTMVGRLVGTVAFMAPEQITGEPVDHRADLYGLGALLYALLTGRRPVIAETIAGYLARQLTEMPTSPVEVNSQVPLRLDRVCMRLLQKDPDQRYASAGDVLAALDAPENVAELPLHGRDEVLERLDARLASLAAGVGGAVAVVGPPGSGRSRCLHEVRLRAEQRGLRVAPPAAWAEAQVLLVDDAGAVTPETRDAVVDRMQNALLERAALLVFAYATPLPSNVHALCDVAPTEEIALPPLDRESVRSLLRDRGLSGGLGAAVTRRLFQEFGGWPGPIVGQLDALLAEGWLMTNADGSVRAIRPIDHLRTDPLPLLLAERAAATAAAAALDADARAVLEAAAVLAMPASVGVLAAAAGLADAARALDTLLRASLVGMKNEGLQELVELVSPRLGQAVCAALPDERRRALHTASARALQSRYGRGGGAIAELIAHHLAAGGLEGEARPLLLAAAQGALRRGDATQAKLLAQRALTLEGRGAAADAAEEARLRRLARTALADAFHAVGQLGKALDGWRDALGVGGAEELETARLLVSSALTALALGQRNPDLLTGLARLPQGDALWVEATQMAAELAWARADPGEAAARWHALAAHSTDTRNPLASILADTGITLLTPGPVIHTVAAWSALLERAQRFGRPGPIVTVAAHLGRVGLEVGDLARVAALAEELAELGERREWSDVGALASALTAQVLGASGDGAGAVRAAKEAISTLKIEEARHAVVAALAIGAWAHFEDAAEAAPWLDAAAFPPTAPFDSEALRQALLALAWQSARPEAAVAAARLAIATPPLSVSGAAWVRISAAQVLRRVGHPVEAAAAVAGLDKALRGNGLVGLVGRLGELG